MLTRCSKLRGALRRMHTCLRQLSAMAPPILSINPTRALVDEKFQVMVENLPPMFPVTLRSLHRSEDRDYWEAYGHYVSDHTGVVAVSKDLSIGGTYSGIEPMGLLWSMKPAPGSRPGLRLRKRDVSSPMLVNISVHSGHEGFREREPLASVQTERWYMAPGVQRIPIQLKEVVGTLFIPSGPGPFPGMLDMWGGGGGLLEYRAALLASHGYASLALEYFKAGELAAADLEFSSFETAFKLLRDHPKVIPDRVGIIGLCLGSNLTLYLTAESNEIQPRCIICISSTDSFPRGQELGKVFNVISDNFDLIRFDENGHAIWREIGLKISQDENKKVEVTKIKCPILFISGCDDQNWPAEKTVQDVIQKMRAAGKGHLVNAVSYPDAGHLIEPPYSPHCRASTFILHQNKKKMIVLWGGQTKPHSDAQEDSWRKILNYLALHMYRNDKNLEAKL